VKLCCPLCGTWTVPFAAVEDDCAGGRCEQCDSMVVITPSETGVTIATARVNAVRAAMSKMAAARTG
jgi:hypothetical protein